MMKKKWCKLAALALTCGSLLAAGCGGGGDKKEAASGGKKVSGNVMVYTCLLYTSPSPCILMSSIPV